MQDQVIAQNLKKRDSLENYIKTAPSDSNKANVLVLLSADLIYYDIKKAEQYASEAIKISQKIDSPKTEAEALLVQAKIHREQNNSLLALNKTITALKIFEKLNDKSGLAKTYFGLGHIYNDISNYKKSIDNYSKSLHLYKETRNEYEVASCQMVMGHANVDRSRIQKNALYLQKALALYTAALNYYKKINNQKEIANSLLSIANLYLNYNQLSPSTNYLDKSLDYSIQSLKIAELNKDKIAMSLNLMNIGEAYNLKKKHSTALTFYLKSYEVVKESSNTSTMILSLQAIIETYKKMNEYGKALALSKEYIKIAKANNYRAFLKDHYKLLSEIYLTKNNIKKAFESRLLYENYSDSVLNEEKAKALIKLQIEFESENKDKEIALLSKNQELQNTKLKQEHTTRNYLMASILLILLLLLVIYSRFIVKTKTNKIIEEKNKQLEKLSIVARETANGVFITDENGNFEWFNEGFSKLFGWKTIDEYKEGRGETILEVSGNKDIKNIIDECVLEKKSIIYDAINPTKDGGQIWVQTTLTPIFDETGNLKKLVFVDSDITKLKDTEKQLMEVNKELESFSYSVSHDLRAPLRAINGYSKILQEDYASKLDPHAMSTLNAILNNSKKMGELVDDLLAFSRLGRTELTTSKINMTNLVTSVIEEEMIENPNKIEFIVNELLPSKGTQTLIKQVWINLISNAIKFSKYNPESHIEIGSYYKDNLVVYFVKDNGVGFDMQYYNKLFGVFQRLHSQDEFEGTGIGLAIVQKIIQRHHGTVWAESKLNEGSCFYFSLPVINA